MVKPAIKINAKSVLDDIHAGLDDEGFKRKYGLSERQLQRLFRKMIAEGFVTPLEMAERLCVTESQVTEAIDQVKNAASELDDS